MTGGVTHDQEIAACERSVVAALGNHLFTICGAVARTLNHAMSVPLPRPDSSHDAKAPLVALGGADRCPNCAAEMAHDQRYCVQCGTRRGKPTFTLSSGASSRGPGADQGGSASDRGGSHGGGDGWNRGGGGPSGGGWSSGVGLVLTIAVLLLALGVGYQIGHGNSSSGGKTVVYSGGVSAASTTPASSAATTTPTSSASTSVPKAKVGADAPKTKAAQKAALKKPSAAVQKAASNAANSVLKTSSTTKLASPTQKVGGKCTTGQEGCQNGTFTGNFAGN